MIRRVSRRRMLKSIGLVGAGAFAEAGLKARTEADLKARTEADLKVRTTTDAGLKAPTTTDVVQAFRPAFAIGGRPVEVLVTSATPSTVRISIVALDIPAMAADGALVDRSWPAPVARL